MKTINHKIFYVKNPETGEFESVMALRGESAYQAAVRLGLTTLTEENWLKEYEVKRAEAIEAIGQEEAKAVANLEDKGQEVLDSIPDDYHEINERVQQTIDKTPIVTHDNGSYYVLDSTDVDNTLSVSGKVADAKVTGEKISQLSEDIYDITDNLLDFSSSANWKQTNLDGAGNVYSITSAQDFTVQGGDELYTAMSGLDKAVLGTVFKLVVRQFDASGNTLSGDVTFSTINDTNPLHYPLNAAAASIRIMLTTSDYFMKITPQMFVEMNPLIYAGFNSAITMDGIYRHKVAKTVAQGEEIEGIASILGTPLAGLIPSSVGNTYPAIDTAAKTFTLYQDALIIDKRLPNGWVSSGATIAHDYSAIGSSAVVFCWDISNATVKSFAYNAKIDYGKYIPLCLLRTTRKSVSCACPVYVDGLVYGTIDQQAISIGSVWRNDIVRGINHRGWTIDTPENTLAAFKASKDHGFDHVETDVRFTADGVAVLLHDDTINRTARNADGSELAEQVRIDSITYEQAAAYDFGLYVSPAFAGTKIPTFELFIRACRRLGLHPYIEIKVGTQAQIEELVNVVFRCGMRGQCTWISYNANMLEWVKNHAEKERLGLLSNDYSADLITQANALKTENNDVFIEIAIPTALTDDVVEAIAAAGIPLETFVNGSYSIASMNPYITGITTDTGNVHQYMYELWDFALQ